MKTSKTDPIRIDFVRSNDYPSLDRLGMTIAPGKKIRSADDDGWNRDLESDLNRLKNHYAVHTLVSLVEESELGLLGIKDFPNMCRSQSLELIQFPIEDGSTPATLDEFARLVGLICGRLNKGGTVAIHCRGGLGRTGLTAACVIIGVSGGNLNAERAIEMVRDARPGTIETSEQERFVAVFADYWMSQKPAGSFL